MQPHEYDTMYAHEDAHWWFQGTRAVIRDVASRALLETAGVPRVLDVGCGTGGTLAALPAPWRKEGVEPEARAVAYCHRRGLHGVVKGTATRLPMRSASFDLVFALDVLEHIEDDAAALAELVRVVRPGGALILTVPAHPSLWSEHDEALHHVRRYRKGEFRALLEGTGLHLELFSYYNCALFPLVALVRGVKGAARGVVRSRRAAPRSDVATPIGPVNSGLAALLGAERWWLRRRCLPFGVSLIACARRSSMGDECT